MHRSDHLSDRVGKQYGDAVSNQSCHGEPRLTGDHRIAGRQRLSLWTIDHRNSPTVHLLHPDQALRRQADTPGEPFPVSSYRFGSITDMLAKIE
jgi:hypothetical protein